MTCPVCGGNLEEYVPNEHGFHCDTCSYPYPKEKEKKGEDE